MNPRRLRNDDGAILIIAIVVVTAVALVVGTLLTRGDGSVRATVALREVAGTTYAADGAGQIAINELRNGHGFVGNPNESAFNNSLDGTGCFGADGPNLTLNGFYPKTGTQTAASSAVVECAGVDGTGMQGSPVPINNSNKPGYAIVTLKGPLTTADPLKVHGGVYSNSSIVGPVSLDAGDAWAFGACSQTTVVAPASKHCNSGAKVSDPNFGDDLGGSIPGLQTPPTACSGGVAIFQPGYYDSAAKLTTATNLCSTAWFKPGTYYFDFHNDSCANVCPSNLYGTSGNVWTINGRNVVGGTPINASGTPIAKPSTNPTYPGSCQSPVTDVNAVGVQFVFGGSSRMYIDQNSHVELCGTYSATKPPIEIYGLKTGSTPTMATANGLNVGSVTATTPPTAFTYAAPATSLVNALAAPADGRTATWTTANNNNSQTTTITTAGFAPGSSVPVGSVLSAATVHIRHQDADATANSAGTAKVTIGGSSTAALAVPQSATMKTDDIAVTGPDLNALQTAVHDNGYAGATVAYTANAKKAATLTSLDLITLDLTYYVPVLRGQGGTCIDGTGGSCEFLSMKNGNNKILLYLQGTTYIPYADANIQLGNFSAEVAKFGIVARQLEFAITNGNPSWTGPIFEIPDNSPGYGYENTAVDLKVHLCPGVPSGCTVSAPLALTARVQLWDSTGAPIPHQRQVSVLSWSHQR